MKRSGYRTSVTLFLWGPLIAATAQASQISGRITANGNPVPEGTRVVVTNSKGSYNASTNKYGAYQVNVRDPQEKTQQTLLVYSGKQALSLSMPTNPSGSPVRLNLVIVGSEPSRKLQRESPDESSR